MTEREHVYVLRDLHHSDQVPCNDQSVVQQHNGNSATPHQGSLAASRRLLDAKR